MRGTNSHQRVRIAPLFQESKHFLQGLAIRKDPDTYSGNLDPDMWFAKLDPECECG